MANNRTRASKARKAKGAIAANREYPIQNERASESEIDAIHPKVIALFRHFQNQALGLLALDILYDLIEATPRKRNQALDSLKVVLYRARKRGAPKTHGFEDPEDLRATVDLFKTKLSELNPSLKGRITDKLIISTMNLIKLREEGRRESLFNSPTMRAQRKTLRNILAKAPKPK